MADPGGRQRVCAPERKLCASNAALVPAPLAQCDDCRQAASAQRPSNVPAVRVGAPVSQPSDRTEREAAALTPAVAAAFWAPGRGGGAGSPPTETSLSAAARSSNGAALGGALRARLEQVTGSDLAPVRLFADPASARAAQDLGAVAVTYGTHIYFGAGGIDTSSPAGRGVLAHEIVHAGRHRHRGVIHRQVAEQNAPTAVRPGSPNAPGSPADPVVLMEMARDNGATVLTTRSGAQIEGHATDLDLDVGSYQLIANPGRRTWTIIGSRGGLHFTLVIPDPTVTEEESGGRRPWIDPFHLAYDQPVLRVTPGASAQAQPVTIDLEATFRAMGGILDQIRVSSSDEELLILMIQDVPAAQSAEFLRRLSQSRTSGHTWLEELDDRISGSNNERLHQVLSLQRMRATPERSIAALANAPVLPWHDVMGFFEDAATFASERSGPGKVRIRYLGGSRIINSTEFGDEIRRLPRNIFISGVEYDDDQPLIIHDYDSGQFVTVVAGELAGYEHLGVRNFLGHVATVASFAIPVSAAESVAGRIAVVTLERVLPAAFLLIDENRRNLVRWFPNWGPKMIQYADTLKMAAAAVGFARLALSGFQMFQQWRAVARSRAALEGAAHVDADAQRVAAQLEREAEDAYTQAERARAAEAARGTGATPSGPTGGEPSVPTSVPGASGGEPVIQGAPHTVPPPHGPVEAAPATRAPSTGGASTTPSPTPSVPHLPDPARGARVAWEGINDETRSMLESSPQVREALEHSPLAAEALKACHSLCYPRFVTQGQIARLETALERAENLNVAVNEREVQRALHAAGSPQDLDHVISQIETGVEARIQVGQDLEEAGAVAGQAPAEEVGSADEGLYLTPTLRNAPGTAHGGSGLAVRDRLLEPNSGIGPMPGQIAARLRAWGRFSSFSELRETFWRMVAQDRRLSQGWSPANIRRMSEGHAPFVGRIGGVPHATGGGANAVLQLNHIRAIKNAGGVFDLDNIEIVSPLLHAAVGD
jgi:hypothetical protein